MRTALKEFFKIKSFCYVLLNSLSLNFILRNNCIDKFKNAIDNKHHKEQFISEFLQSISKNLSVCARVLFTVYSHTLRRVQVFQLKEYEQKK